MNTKQREVFAYLRDWSVNKAKGNQVDAFRVFVTGGAGTGKSHVINGFNMRPTAFFHH